MTYFDNAATTPPFPETVDAVAKAMRATFGNPASPHRAGLEAERLVKDSMDRLARLLGALPEELIATSGGTESITTALTGYLAANPRCPRRIVTTRAEHPAVLRTLERLTARGVESVLVGVDRQGKVRLDELERALETPTGLVCLLHVNNETGAIQPMDDVAALLRRYPGTALHLDCVQSFGKVPLALRRWGVRLASFSAHKFHGPKGVGLLFVEKGVRIEPLLVGGGQQRGLRSGTENPPGVFGLATAAGILAARHDEYLARTTEIRTILLDGFARIERVPVTVLSPDDGLPSILSVSFAGVRPQTLVNALSERGFYLSTVSACSSRRAATSHVLQAMGLPEELAASAVRISTSVLNELTEAHAFLDALPESLAQLLPKR